MTKKTHPDTHFGNWRWTKTCISCWRWYYLEIIRSSHTPVKADSSDDIDNGSARNQVWTKFYNIFSHVFEYKEKAVMGKLSDEWNVSCQIWVWWHGWLLLWRRYTVWPTTQAYTSFGEEIRDREQGYEPTRVNKLLSGKTNELINALGNTFSYEIS